MNLRRITVDDALPIPIAAVRKALRIDHAFDEDVLERKVRAAVELVEERTTRVLRPTTFLATLSTWPTCDVCLPRAPVVAIEEVAYVGEDGVSSIVAPAEYGWRPTEDGAELWFASGWSWPSFSREVRDPVRIKFEAGYGGDAGDDPERKLPSRVEELVLLLAGHWYKNREAVTVGAMAEVPIGASLLFKELRHFR